MIHPLLSRIGQSTCLGAACILLCGDVSAQQAQRDLEAARSKRAEAQQLLTWLKDGLHGVQSNLAERFRTRAGCAEVRRTLKKVQRDLTAVGEEMRMGQDNLTKAGDGNAGMEAVKAAQEELDETKRDLTATQEALKQLQDQVPQAEGVLEALDVQKSLRLIRAGDDKLKKGENGNGLLKYHEALVRAPRNSAVRTTAWNRLAEAAKRHMSRPPTARPEEALAQAREHLENAEEALQDGREEGARREFLKAFIAAPNYREGKSAREQATAWNAVTMIQATQASRAYIQVGEEALRQGKHEAAIQAFESAVKMAPMNSSVHTAATQGLGRAKLAQQ